MLSNIFDKIFAKNKQKRQNTAQMPPSTIIQNDKIIFNDYPYKPSSVCKSNGVLLAKDIVAYITLPNAFVVVNRHLGAPFYELIAMRYATSDEIATFAKRNGLRKLNHTDNWIYLLEEYLDTEYSQETHENFMERLRKNGFLAQEITAIKAKEGKMVDWCNGFAWEWIMLDVFYLLHFELHNPKGKIKYLLFPKKFDDFYKRAMTIALKGANLKPLNDSL